MKKTRWIAALLFLAAAGLAVPAHAHKVSLFAWVEGDTVYTQSKFSGGKKAKGASVTVYDEQGARLLSGRTDPNGEFSFKIPKPSPLRIVLAAGSGHQSEWTVPLEEIEAMGAAGASPLPAAAEPASKPEKDGKISPGPGTSESLSDAELKGIETAVEKVLERKLRPMMRILAETRDRGPGLADILGGIGYIIGLVGIGAYVHSRKQKSD